MSASPTRLHLYNEASRKTTGNITSTMAPSNAYGLNSHVNGSVALYQTHLYYEPSISNSIDIRSVQPALHHPALHCTAPCTTPLHNSEGHCPLSARTVDAVLGTKQLHFVGLFHLPLTSCSVAFSWVMISCRSLIVPGVGRTITDGR